MRTGKIAATPVKLVHLKVSLADLFHHPSSILLKKGNGEVINMSWVLAGLWVEIASSRSMSQSGTPTLAMNFARPGALSIEVKMFSYGLCRPAS
jgi:hypothetical protein